MAWIDITNELNAATLTATEQLLLIHEKEELYALALFTADDGMSVEVAANTEEGYRSHLASEAEEEESSTEDEVYYRWASSEWVMEGWKDDVFKNANALIARQNKDDFEQYFRDLIDTMTEALVHVKRIMGDKLADVTVFVTVTDSDAAEGIEDASAGRINDSSLATAFRSRFG